MKFVLDILEVLDRNDFLLVEPGSIDGVPLLSRKVFPEQFQQLRRSGFFTFPAGLFQEFILLVDLVVVLSQLFGQLRVVEIEEDIVAVNLIADLDVMFLQRTVGASGYLHQIAGCDADGLIDEDHVIDQSEEDVAHQQKSGTHSEKGPAPEFSQQRYLLFFGNVERLLDRCFDIGHGEIGQQVFDAVEFAIQGKLDIVPQHALVPGGKIDEFKSGDSSPDIPACRLGVDMQRCADDRQDQLHLDRIALVNITLEVEHAEAGHRPVGSLVHLAVHPYQQRNVNPLRFAHVIEFPGQHRHFRFSLRICYLCGTSEPALRNLPQHPTLTYVLSQF